jgi:hypothetical protein
MISAERAAQKVMLMNDHSLPNRQPDASRHDPDSPSKRVARSRAKSINDGARRVEVILRDPDSIASLDRLTDEHGSVTAAVTAALKR